MWTGDNLRINQFNTTCSLAADRRGFHQKIISFSLYGDLSQTTIVKRYLDPLKETIHRIPHIYPGWTVRIYHNFTLDESNVKSWKIFESTFSVGNHVDICNVTEVVQKRKLTNIFGMTWRWLPMLDAMVDTLMSRDSDSQIVPREQEAVREWLSSGKTFHVMRDHPVHCMFGFIMGCCWGVKISKDRLQVTRQAEKMFTTFHLHQYDFDQKLLDKFIWPIARTSVMAHDSYCCNILKPSMPFPFRRKDRLYVGSKWVNKEVQKLSDLDECPKECRPKNHNLSLESKFC